MPTNEKSEKHICHSSSSPCGGCQTIKDHCTCQPPPDKLAEAKKLLNNWEKRGYGYNRFQVQNLLAAQDLISYERGREERAKEFDEWFEAYRKGVRVQIEQLETQNKVLLNTLTNREQMKIDVDLKCDFPCEECHKKAQQALKSDNQNADAK